MQTRKSNGFLGAAARALAVSLLAAPALPAGQYALLVGVSDYPGKDRDLRACTKDVARMKAFLIDKYGFEEADIRTLLDGKATTAAFRDAIERHLVARAQPGDSVVLFFSGHGTQAPDLDGDEKDNADEMLVTADADPRRPETWMTDDVLRYYLARLKTDRCMVILDCCHAGTGTRGFGPAPIDGEKYAHLGFERLSVATRSAGPSAPIKRPSTNPSHVLMAACAEGEVAREISDKGAFFTLCLLSVMEKTDADTPLSSVRDEVSVIMGDIISQSNRPDLKQHPQFEGPIERPFGDYLTPKAPAQMAGSPSAPAAPAPEQANALASGDIAIKLSVDKPVYTEGDLMTATLEAERDCYVRLYYRSSDGKVFLIFPNKFHQDNRIRGGTPVRLPGPGAHFLFRMSEPYGQEILLAVAQGTQFSDARKDSWSDAPLIEFPSMSFRQMRTRGVAVTGAEKGEAIVIYEVKPKPQ